MSALYDYKNEQVVLYFCRIYSHYSFKESIQLFDDLLSWIWLNQLRRKQGKKTYLFGPLLILDDMWHAFILHTRDYVYFSNHYCGAYFHHDIEIPGSEHVMKEEELRDFLHDCFKYLGNEWVERYFSAAWEEPKAVDTKDC